MTAAARPLLRRTLLESGTTVVSERVPGAESVSFGLYFPTGSRFETERNNGMSHLIEHLVFKGTSTRSAEEVNREIDLLGGASNAYTSKEVICFHSRVLPEQLPRLIDLFGDLAAHALPDGVEAELEREREVILAEISAVEDSPEDLVGDLCDRAYFGEHPLALPVVGSAQALSRLTFVEIRSHFRAEFVARDLVVAAAGDVDHEDLVGQIRSKLADIPYGEPRSQLEGPRPVRGSHVLDRNLEQVHLCLSAGGLSRDDRRRRSAELLSLIVGDGYSSRLFREVRDRRGLAYSIYSSTNGYLDAGSFNIYAAVAPAKLEEMLSVVGGVLADVRDRGLTQDELDSAKLHLRTSLLLGYESSGTRMGYLAEQVMIGSTDLTLASELREIEAVCLDELNALAAELLEGALAVGAVGPLTSERFAQSGWEIAA